MLINLRNALMSGKRLPYQCELEYLESTGTQYIDTGYSFNSATDSVELVFELLTTTPNYKWIFGAYDASKRFAIGSGDGVKRRTLGYNASTSYNSSTYYTDSAHIFLADSAGASIDGHNFFAFADFSTTSHIILYSIPIDISTYCANARIWSYKHYRNNVLVRDYIPVRKGTVGYLYDRVSGKLFGNEGSGDFALGPDVVPVEYIESHGTEYIDTGGVKTSNSIGLSINCAGIGTDQWICGGRGGYKSGALGLYRIPSGKLRVCYGSLETETPFDTNRHAIKLEDDILTIDGQQIFTFQSNTFSNDSSIYLFNLNINTTGTPSNIGMAGKVYGATFSNNHTLVRSFRPIRVGTDATSWEGAMMDTLTRRIYRNAGTGAFAYGNDV